MAWVALSSAVISLSSVAPTFKLMNHPPYIVPPLRAILWRQETIIIYLFIPALVEFLKATKSNRAAWLSRENLWNLWWASACWALSICLWVRALVFTTAVRASLLGSLPPIVLAIHARFRGVHLMKGELIGIGLAIFGVVTCMGTGLWQSSGGSAKEVIGDLMCVSSSIVWAFDFVYSARCRQVMPVCMYSILGSIIMLVLVLPASVLIESTSTRDVFDWVAPEYLKLVLVFGFVAGVLGILGLNWAVAHINPILVSMVCLLDPLFTGIFAWLMKVDGVPDVFTFVGGFIVLSGVMSASIADQKRKKAQEQEKKKQEEMKEIQTMWGSTEDVEIDEEGNAI